MPTIMLSIDGMTCGHCQRAVTQALEDVDGVKRATVNLEAGTATVDAEDATDAASLLAAVEEEGYEARIQ